MITQTTEEQLVQSIQMIIENHPNYGTKRIACAVKEMYPDLSMSRNRVAKLMSRRGLTQSNRRAIATRSQGGSRTSFDDTDDRATPEVVHAVGSVTAEVMIDNLEDINGSSNGAENIKTVPKEPIDVSLEDIRQGQVTSGEKVLEDQIVADFAVSAIKDGQEVKTVACRNEQTETDEAVMGGRKGNASKPEAPLQENSTVVEDMRSSVQEEEATEMNGREIHVAGHVEQTWETAIETINSCNTATSGHAAVAEILQGSHSAKQESNFGASKEEVAKVNVAADVAKVECNVVEATTIEAAADVNMKATESSNSRNRDNVKSIMEEEAIAKVVNAGVSAARAAASGYSDPALTRNQQEQQLMRFDAEPRSPFCGCVIQ